MSLYLADGYAVFEEKREFDSISKPYLLKYINVMYAQSNISIPFE